MGVFIQSILNGLSIGSSYALVAVGFTLIFGVLRVVYLTHAAVLAVGAYVGFFVLHYTGSVFITLLAGMTSSAIVGVIKPSDPDGHVDLRGGFDRRDASAHR
jgi:branched-chain amino acid transport system permease protein